MKFIFVFCSYWLFAAQIEASAIQARYCGVLSTTAFKGYLDSAGVRSVEVELDGHHAVRILPDAEGHLLNQYAHIVHDLYGVDFIYAFEYLGRAAALYDSRLRAVILPGLTLDQLKNPSSLRRNRVIRHEIVHAHIDSLRAMNIDILFHGSFEPTGGVWAARLRNNALTEYAQHNFTFEEMVTYIYDVNVLATNWRSHKRKNGGRANSELSSVLSSTVDLGMKVNKSATKLADELLAAQTKSTTKYKLQLDPKTHRRAILRIETPDYTFQLRISGDALGSVAMRALGGQMQVADLQSAAGRVFLDKFNERIALIRARSLEFNTYYVEAQQALIARNESAVFTALKKLKNAVRVN